MDKVGLHFHHTYNGKKYQKQFSKKCIFYLLKVWSTCKHIYGYVAYFFTSFVIPKLKEFWHLGHFSFTKLTGRNARNWIGRRILYYNGLIFEDLNGTLIIPLKVFNITQLQKFFLITCPMINCATSCIPVYMFFHFRCIVFLGQKNASSKATCDYINVPQNAIVQVENDLCILKIVLGYYCHLLNVR